MDDSKFHLWRASFAFCYVDVHLSPTEEKWIRERLEILPFTSAQKSQIEDDLKNPPKVLNLLSKITSPADRGMLLNNVRQLAYIDDKLSPEERAKIQILKDEIMARLDLPGLQKRVGEVEVPTQSFSRHTFLQKTIASLMDK
jgi:hypothetical protein